MLFRSTATRILELTGETLVGYLGNFDYYLEKREELTRVFVNTRVSGAKDTPSGQDGKRVQMKQDWQTKKAEQARIRRLENSLKKTEEQIEQLEGRIAAIDAECSRPEVATNSARLNELAAEQEACRRQLEDCYEAWEEVSVSLERG